MAKIEIKNIDSSQEIIELLAAEYTIGRSESNSIRLNDARSSRHHARIFNKGSEYYIEDIGSANGTLVNNSKLLSNVPQRLEAGDTIMIGQSSIVISGIENAKDEIADSEFMPYSDTGLLFDTSAHELSATLDASISLAQLTPADAHDSETMAKALKRMEAMCIIAEAIGNIMKLEELMTKVIDTVFSIFPKAERSFILLKEAEVFRPVAARSRSKQQIDLKNLKISTTVLNTCTQELRSILSNNTAEDERFSEAMSIAELSIESLICSPLVINGAEVLGIIQVESASNVEEFDETDLQILTGISGQIAIAVKNISLAREIETESAQRANLQRYFSPNMVEMMLSGDINTELGGKEYEGTVFFSDIIGFTAMSEKMEAREVVANLNRYFTVMQGLIYKNKGNVDKFGGDAIMAFWSVPKHDPHDEFHAILTGIQMQCELYPFNIDLKAENIVTIYMGIGINTGDFVAGNIGSDDKIEFTLIGDNVNLAARIEARAGKTQVMCSKETYSRVAERVSAVELPAVHFKGKSEPQHTYSIRAIKTSENRLKSNIPVRIITKTDEISTDFYMLSEIAMESGNRFVSITADAEFSAGEELRFKCCLNEYHENIELTARVQSVTHKLTPAGKKLNEYLMQVLEGDNFIRIAKPGFTYITELSWDDMPRERGVEGN